MKILVCSEYSFDSNLMPSAIFARKYYEWARFNNSFDGVYALAGIKSLFIKKTNNVYSVDKAFYEKISFKNCKLIFKRVIQKAIDSLFFDYSTFLLIKSIVNRENIDCLIVFVWNPRLYKSLIKLSKKTNVKIIVVTVDPIFLAPKKQLIKYEKKCIEESLVYFVPENFLAQYKQKYKKDNIYPFSFPCSFKKKSFISKKTINKIQISYFGNANIDRIVSDLNLLNKPDYKIDFYGWYKKEFCEKYYFCNFNAPVAEDKMQKIIAESDFLLLLDNGSELKDYLPSKTITYASSTKPILAFGKNNDSALRRFLDSINYPYYYHIEGENNELLLKFISNNFALSFNETIYNQMRKYLPRNVFETTTSIIMNKINDLID